MWILITLYSLVCFILFFFLHHYFYKKAQLYSINKANQKAIRWSSQSKPVAGGITFFLSFIIGTTFYLLSQRTNAQIQSEYLFISLALIFAFFTGLADDMLSIAPGLKMVLQAFAAFILIYSGLYIRLFPYWWANYLISFIWYVGMMNSINMLDNMDAITTSISIIITSGFLFLNIYNFHHTYELFILINLLIALVTFLFFNYYPSKMYMGDNGSLFLGLLLAIMGMKYVWNFPVSPLHSDWVKMVIPFLSVLLFFLIPLTDTFTVTVNRLMRKQSPLIGGKDHTTHALFYMGLSEVNINFLLSFLQMVSLIFAIYLILTDFQNKTIVILSIIYSIFVVLFLFINATIRNKKNKDLQGSTVRF